MATIAAQLNSEIDAIERAYEDIEGEPLHGRRKTGQAHPKSPKSAEFVKGLRDINVSLKDSNNIITRYINNSILTPKIVKGFDKFSKQHKNKRSGDQNDILVYMAKYVKDVKMRKKEDTFFTAVNRFGDILRHQVAQISKSPNKEHIMKSLRVKLVNANRLVTFVRKYMFFVTHLNTDYHFVDRDFAKYGEKEPENAEHHSIKFKGFTKSNDHVPLTIVISKEDLMNIQNSSTVTSDIKTGAESEESKYIEKHISRTQSTKNNPNDYSADTNNGEANGKGDDNGYELLAHEKIAQGISPDPNATLPFVERKPELDLDSNTFDLDYNKSVQNIIPQIKEDKSPAVSELENLNNLDFEDGKPNSFDQINSSMYEQTQQNLNGVPTSSDDYLHKLLNINKESEELHVSTQSGSNEGSSLELIRQPNIESVHDHGYITLVNSDDDRNIRMSKMSEYDKTPLGTESKQITDSYNKISSMSSQQVNSFMQKQDKKTQGYFRPIIDQTFKSMNQEIVEPKAPIVYSAPYYAQNRTLASAVPLNTANNSQSGTSVRLSNTPTANPPVHDRRLLSSRNGYWDRKAEYAFKNLLSGKF